MKPDGELSGEETELIRALRRVGISERAAMIYVMLTHRNSLTATEIAGALHTNRMAVYRSVEKLIARGLLTVSLGTPTRYTAASIDTLMDILLKECEREAEMLTRMRGGLVANMGRHLKEDETLPSFQVVKGKARAMAVAKRLIKQAAERVIFVAGAEEVALARRAGVINAYREAARVLHTQGITEINPSNCSSIAKIFTEAPNLELRHLDRYRGLQFLGIDGRKSLVGIVTDPTIVERGKTKDTFLYVMSATFARSLDATFAYLWNDATDATMRFNQLAENT